MTDRSFHKSVAINSDTLSYWMYLDSTTSTSTEIDNHHLNVLVGTATYLYTEDLLTATRDTWFQIALDVSSYNGQTATLTFSASVDTGQTTLLYIDDISLGTDTASTTYEIIASATGGGGTGGSVDPSLNYWGWPATTGGSYSGLGTGNLVLEFATYLGSTISSTTWRIDRDIFRCDLNTDNSKIVSRTLGKTVSMETAKDIVGISTDYTLTAYYGQHETYTSGYTASATTVVNTYGHNISDDYNPGEVDHTDPYHPAGDLLPAYDYWVRIGDEQYDVHDFDPAGINFTYGDEETEKEYATRTHVIGLMELKVYGDADTLNLFPGTAASFPTTFIVGTETITVESVRYWDTVGSFDGTPMIVYWTDGFNSRANGYPHAKGTPVYYQIYNTTTPTTTSKLSQYGYKDNSVIPLGCVDKSGVEQLSYGVLQHATTGDAWGIGSVFATMLTSDITLGDWVSIEDRTGTGTTSYRIIGIEYDQKTQMYKLQFGVTEDYYGDLAYDNKTTYDLALSSRQ